MRVFFTADQHFGHGGARGLFRRPFGDTPSMDEAMRAAWNTTVEPDDVVWHLGDLAVRPEPARIEALLGTLNGTKHLVYGNNDPNCTRAAGGWSSVQGFAEIEVDGVPVVLCHYALRVWNRQGKGAWNLHGHSHGRLRPLTRQVDVGVDVWDFRPVTLATIVAARRRRARKGSQ